MNARVVIHGSSSIESEIPQAAYEAIGDRREDTAMLLIPAGGVDRRRQSRRLDVAREGTNEHRLP